MAWSASPPRSRSARCGGGGVSACAGLFVEARGPNGGTAGGGDGVAAIRRSGAYDVSPVRRGSRMVGLVPDGVATIEFSFARGRSLAIKPRFQRRGVATAG